jgi:hypothetical protein
MVEKVVAETGSKSLTFISQIISATAWPITVLTCVLLVRKHLVALIPLVRTVKYSDVEIQFGKELEHLAKAVDRASLPNEPSKSDSARWEDLIVLADVRPRSAIRSAWRRVEGAMLQAAKTHNIEVADAAQSMPMVVGSILLNQGVISTAKYDLLSKLRGLADDAEHAPPDAINSDSAVEFIGLALRLAASIDPKAGDMVHTID